MLCKLLLKLFLRAFLVIFSVRLSETLYSVKTIGEGVAADDLNRLVHNMGTEKSCLPFGSLEYTDNSNMTGGPQLHFPERESKRRNTSSLLSGYSFYIDADVSAELQSKVGFVCS